MCLEEPNHKKKQPTWGEFRPPSLYLDDLLKIPTIFLNILLNASCTPARHRKRKYIKFFSIQACNAARGPYPKPEGSSLTAPTLASELHNKNIHTSN